MRPGLNRDLVRERTAYKLGRSLGQEKFRPCVKRVTQQNRKRLAQIRAARCQFVQLLPAKLKGCCCSAALALCERVISIEQAGDVPLPGCDAKCQCYFLAAKDPKAPLVSAATSALEENPFKQAR